MKCDEMTHTSVDRREGWNSDVDVHFELDWQTS